MVPVSMMCPSWVIRSTMAAQSLGSVNPVRHLMSIVTVSGLELGESGDGSAYCEEWALRGPGFRWSVLRLLPTE